MPAPPVRGPGLVSRRLRVADGDVVWLRAVLEAHDHLASLHGPGDGTVEITTTASRAPELDALLMDLGQEIRFEPLGGGRDEVPYFSPRTR